MSKSESLQSYENGTQYADVSKAVVPKAWQLCALHVLLLFTVLVRLVWLFVLTFCIGAFYEFFMQTYAHLLLMVQPSLD